MCVFRRGRGAPGLLRERGKTMSDERIRVMVAEDDTLLRNTLSELLRLEKDIVLVSAVPNGEQAIAEAHIVKPHVILMDIEMPRMNGIDATRNLGQALPEIRAVILT